MANDVEIAPKGTRKLLEEIAATLRGYEKHHRDRAAEAAKDEGLSAIERRDGAVSSTEKADRNARLAGRIEATLAGWEQ